MSCTLFLVGARVRALPAPANTPKETLPLLDSVTIQTQAEAIAGRSSHQPGVGYPPIEADPHKTSVLLAALAEGNYRVVACRLAGISDSSLSRVYKRAEAGEDGAIALVTAIENAEAMAEAGIVKKWRNAVDAGPQYWAAAATFLERKSPDRWGRRTDDSSAPKVVVQIGASGTDVAVNVITNYQTQSPSEALTGQALTDTPLTPFAGESGGRKVLDVGEGATTSAASQAPHATPSRRADRRGTHPGAPAPQARRRAGQGKGVSAGGRKKKA